MLQFNRLNSSRDWLPTFRIGQVACVFGVLLAIGYLPSLNAPFIFDDFLNLVNNPQIRSLLPNEQSWRESRPVGFYSFALNYALHGLRPAGFRLVNMLIHLAAAITLFVLIRDSVRRLSDVDWQARAERIAFCTALVWLVHPLQTAAITCIVQRFEALMGLFFLLTLLALQRSTMNEKRLVWQVAAVVCFWLGMGCKEVMATCLPVAILYDRIFLTQSWRTTFRERGVAYFAMLLSFAWLGWAVSGAYANGANATAGFGISQVSAWEYLRSQPAVILHYLRLCLWPDVLCIDYGWPIETSPWRIYGLGAIIVSLLIAAIVLLYHQPAVGFLVLAFFLILGPTSSIMPIADLAFEHRMYLPLALVSLLFVLSMEVIAFKLSFPHQYIMGCAIVLALPLVMRTALRNGEYRDPERIWMGAIAMNPEQARSHFLLAEHLVRVHRGEAAVVRYREAIKVRPRYIAAYNNAALTLERLQQTDAAITTLRQAIQLEPNDPYLHFNHARLLAQQQNWPAARASYEKSLQLAPQYAPAQKQLAVVISKLEANPVEYPR